MGSATGTGAEAASPAAVGPVGPQPSWLATGLIERSSALGELTAALAAGGGMALVAGEAGIGKSALVGQFLRRDGRECGFLLGTCDPLLTPRKLGPLHDIARQTGGKLADLLASEAPREAVFSALLDELALDRWQVVVVEDAHWGRRRNAGPAGVPRATARPADGAAGGHLPRRRAEAWPSVAPGPRPASARGAPPAPGAAVSGRRGGAGPASRPPGHRAARADRGEPAAGDRAARRRPARRPGDRPRPGGWPRRSACSAGRTPAPTARTAPAAAPRPCA